MQLSLVTSMATAMAIGMRVAAGRDGQMKTIKTKVEHMISGGNREKRRSCVQVETGKRPAAEGRQCE